jgi:hypothetical protein
MAVGPVRQFELLEPDVDPLGLFEETLADVGHVPGGFDHCSLKLGDRRLQTGDLGLWSFPDFPDRLLM